MVNHQISLQDLVRQNGPLNAGMAAAYISQIADELQHMHTVRRICHLDVRPATITILPDGKAALEASTMSQTYTEDGVTTDLRDLKAVHHYLLSGKKEVSAQPQQPSPKETITEKAVVRNQPQSKKNPWPWLVAIAVCAAVAAFLVFALKLDKQPSATETATHTYADFVWQGQWKGGEPHGQGVARYHDGRIYKGRMVKAIRKDKNARFTYADGNVFIGEFAGDTIRQGRVMLSSGEYYFVGKFSGGAPYDGYWFRTSDDRKVEHVEKGKETLL